MPANALTINGIVKSDDDYLAKAQALPKNASADGNGGSFEISGTEGAIEVVIEVTTIFSVADLKTITLKLQDSADNAAFADLATIYAWTGAGAANTSAVGTELGKYIIPTSARRYIKAVLTTDDAAGTGAIDIFQNYLAR